MSGSVRQYIRQCSLVAQDVDKEGLELAELRVTFEVTSWVVSAPAQIVARIYNLSDQTAQKLLNLKTTPVGSTIGVATGGAGSGAAQVTLKAGYSGNFGVIFSGDLVQARWGRESPTDTYVELIAAEGIYAHTWGLVNVTLAQGWKPSDVNDKIKEAYKVYGVNVEDLPSEVQQKEGPRGKVLYGSAAEHRGTLCSTHQLNSYFRQGTGKWLPWSAYSPGDIIQVNSNTGMIMMPTQTEFGLTVRMLLNPSVGPGTLIQINNKDIQLKRYETGVNQTKVNMQLQQNLGPTLEKQKVDDKADGSYKVLNVNHIGDTRGNDWYTQADCIATSTQRGQWSVPDGYKWALQL